MLDVDAIADINGDCAAVYRLADAEEDAPPSIGTIVARLLGERPRFASMRNEATLAIVDGAPRIFIRRGTSAPRARWLTGHELAEWWYARIGYRGEDIEERCDALGAALVVPRAALCRARRAVGEEPRDLAEAMKTTQSLALLRLGECFGAPVVLLRQAPPIVRGDAFAWPGEPELRRAVREARPGLRKVTITDEPRRLGVLAV